MRMKALIYGHKRQIKRNRSHQHFTIHDQVLLAISTAVGAFISVDCATMESITSFKLFLRNYKESRATLVKQIQEFINVRNQLTFVSSDMLQKTIGVDIKASRATYRLDSRLEELTASIAETKEEVNEAVRNLNSKLPTTKSKEGLIDNDTLTSIINQIQQQSVLECIIVDKLLSPDGALIDADSLTTFIACFEHPPYLVEAELDALLLV